MSNALLYAGAGTGFTFLMTTLGAAVVFFFRKAMSSGIQKVLLGFAAGVISAAEAMPAERATAEASRIAVSFFIAQTFLNFANQDKPYGSAAI